jgi:hypothetical protein
MHASRALGKLIFLITMMVVSACNQTSAHDPLTTVTPNAQPTPADDPAIGTAPVAVETSVAAPTELGAPTELTVPPGTLSLEEELAEIGRRQRETIDASTAFNTPPELQLGRQTRIQLLLSYRLPEDALGTQVTAPGPVSTDHVEITPRVMAELTSPDPKAFTIVPITQAEQVVGDTETREWLWYVTANKSGAQTLTIVLSRGVEYENRIHWVKVETYEQTIPVRGAWLHWLQSAGWIWIAGIFLAAGAAIALIWRRVGRKQTSTSDGRNQTRQDRSGGPEIDSSAPQGERHIFISYRRSDSADITGRIYDRLVDEFGRTPIFKDVDSIPLGTDFKEYLDRKVSECNVLLAIIGDRWTEASDEAGKRRLDDPADFVRVEIESALERGIPVIPLLVSQAKMHPEGSLPRGLRKLHFQNGMQIRPDPDFHRDMDRLISALDQLLGRIESR